MIASPRSASDLAHGLEFLRRMLKDDDAFAAFDTELRVHFWSDGMARVTGVDASDAAGLDLRKVFPQLEPSGELRFYQDALEGRARALDECVHLAGGPLSLERVVIGFAPIVGSASVVGGYVLLRPSSDDELLSDAERRFRTMADSAPVLLWMSGPDALCTFFNHTWLEFTGRTLEQERGVGWAEGVHPEDFARCMDTYMECFRARRSFEMVYRLRRKDGDYRWILDRGVPFTAPDGAFAGFIGSCADITDIRRTEAALRESEQRFRLVYESSPSGIATLASDLRFLHANPTLQTMLGMREDALRGTTLLELVPGGARAEVQASFAALFDRKGGGEGGSTSLEIPLTTPHRGQVWVRTSSVAVRDERGRLSHAITLLEDVSERRRLERELLQSQKMEVVGRLAGGMAHEFNNLLTAISGRAEMASLRTEFHEVHTDLTEIRLSCERAARLCRQLLAFGRREHAEPSVVDVRSLAQRVRSMLHPMLGEKVHLSIELSPEPLYVRADPGHVEQVLLNLALNARDAMPDGGRMWLRSRAETAPALGDESVGEVVCLEVTDEGVGMSSDVQSHLFEPFFTTKERGKGTGLGLATCYGLVQQAGGTIRCDSATGRGTSFFVRYPRVREPEANDAAAAGSRPERVGRESILLVEDESAVRDVIARILRAKGYRVTEATDAEAVFAALPEMEQPALLVSDVIMPGMNGAQLARRLRERWPELPVLLISGYASDAIPHFHDLGRGWAFLQKPFELGELLRHAGELIEAAAKS